MTTTMTTMMKVVAIDKILKLMTGSGLSQLGTFKHSHSTKGGIEL